MHLTFSVRSSVNRGRRRRCFSGCGTSPGSSAAASQMGEYPPPGSTGRIPSAGLMVEVYREMFGSEPQVVAIHAGLSAGLLGDKLPGLDCVSYGPRCRTFTPAGRS